MFKLFAVVFAAILALAVAAPKPGIYSPAPLVASSPLAYTAYQAPLSYASAYSAPLTYNAYNPYAYSGAYAAAPIAYY